LGKWRLWFKKPPPDPLRKKGKEEKKEEMKINRNNYEAFFIDYLEGNLDERLVDDFIEFLQQNPDLKEELSLFETVSIGQEEITFNKKDSLFREMYDNENEFDRAAIARLEGDILASEKAEFENYLSTHPEKQKEVELFEKTKLQPDKKIVFGKKNRLYHRSAGKTILLWTTRVAAVVIVALSVYIYIDKSSTENITQNQVVTLEKEHGKKINSAEIKKMPVEKNTTEVQKITLAEVVKTAINKEQAKPNLSENSRENSPDSRGNEGLATARLTEEIPAELESLTPSIYAASPKTDLVPVKLAIPKMNETMYDEKLLVDVIKEKTGIGKLTFNKITKAGLSLVSNLSKEKFKYETNTDGKVTELNFESRIFAFYIPTNNEEARK
jgi:hypothetical protein